MMNEEQRRVLIEAAQLFTGTDRRRAVLNELAASAAPAEGREPDAWMVLAANTGKPCEVTLHKSETEALRQDCVVPLYRAAEGREAVDDQVRAIINNLGCLIPNPADPQENDWPCKNPADRECLQNAYVAARSARAALATAPTMSEAVRDFLARIRDMLTNPNEPHLAVRACGALKHIDAEIERIDRKESRIDARVRKQTQEQTRNERDDIRTTRERIDRANAEGEKS